jgi:hypothetical protein
MPNDDLTTILNQFSRAMWDPTAPLPSIWPGGAMGVFLVFVTQIGAGIPLGVIMARNAGLPVALTAALYLASDVVLALTMEPVLMGLRWLGQRLARFSGAAGLKSDGVRGPLGLILFSFTVSPTAGRAASEAAGHGFISGWTLAIIGDMAYFGLIMASTLWVSSVFGDDRVTIGAVLLGTWVLPLLVRRLRRKPQPAPAGVVRAAPALQLSGASTATSTQAPRRPVAHNGRRRRSSRGLHR